MVRYSFCCIKASVSLLLRRGGAGVTLLLFLVNSVARQNFVGKTNAQPIFTTTTTGPMVMQDVARINGVHLVQAHLHLRCGGPAVGQRQAKKRWWIRHLKGMAGLLRLDT